MNNNDINSRIEAVERLVNLFKAERMVYLGITFISLVMLLASALFLIFRSQAEPSVLVMLFGSSGLIGYSTNRILHMFDQALRLFYLSHDNKKTGEEK